MNLLVLILLVAAVIFCIVEVAQTRSIWAVGALICVAVLAVLQVAGK